MKKLLIIPILFLTAFCFAQTTGTKIASPFVRNAATDNYPLGYAHFNNGGYHSYPTKAGRDSLLSYYPGLLRDGMLVYCRDVDSTYRYVKTSNSWEPYVSGKIFTFQSPLSVNGSNIVSIDTATAFSQLAHLNGNQTFNGTITFNGTVSGGNASFEDFDTYILRLGAERFTLDSSATNFSVGGSSLWQIQGAAGASIGALFGETGQIYYIENAGSFPITFKNSASLILPNNTNYSLQPGGLAMFIIDGVNTNLARMVNIAAPFNYTPENQANKQTILTNSTTDYPSTSAVNSALSAYASLTSPALTGTPMAPTATTGTNTTQLATTAFVQNVIASNPQGYVTTSSTSTFTNKTISGTSNTFSNIPNSALTNNTISGIALGGNLNGVLFEGGLAATGIYNGSAAIFVQADTTFLKSKASSLVDYNNLKTWNGSNYTALGLKQTKIIPADPGATNRAIAAGDTINQALYELQKQINTNSTVISSNVPKTVNKGMAANVTTTDGQAASGTAILTTPVNGGYVAVYVNGILINVGDGVKSKEAYFSGDGGTTARALNAIQAGDKLYWNGSIAGYQLAVSDVISFLYI